jgi:hypothetical protein
MPVYDGLHGCWESYSKVLVVVDLERAIPHKRVSLDCCVCPGCAVVFDLEPHVCHDWGEVLTLKTGRELVEGALRNACIEIVLGDTRTRCVLATH